jgi:hypothetical protein
MKLPEDQFDHLAPALVAKLEEMGIFIRDPEGELQVNPEYPVSKPQSSESSKA